ncbi:MAG: ribosomal RNA small subunit methyltransferase A [Verrucomicrobiales bacterium]|nr:ribosomal RNA small subunit methyltransferase A [Verrucomicrobiales bacterium]
MTLGEMRRWLETRGIVLTKSLGQNFLHDGNQLRRIADAAGIVPGDSLLEIGPGLGPLTELLLARGNPVTAVEVDRRLVEILKERFGGEPNFTLVQADALAWLRETPRDWSTTKLVANLPYSVGSPILVELALAPLPPSRMVVTLQWEVIRRLGAAPGTEDYGVLTLLIAARYAAGASFKIPSSCFHPPPDVESACLTLTRRGTPLVSDQALSTYVRAVKQAFSQRRKMMRKLLSASWPPARVESAMSAAGIPTDARAETISPVQFAALAQGLQAADASEGTSSST